MHIITHKNCSVKQLPTDSKAIGQPIEKEELHGSSMTSIVPQNIDWSLNLLTVCRTKARLRSTGQQKISSASFYIHTYIDKTSGFHGDLTGIGQKCYLRDNQDCSTVGYVDNKNAV